MAGAAAADGGRDDDLAVAVDRKVELEVGVVPD